MPAFVWYGQTSCNTYIIGYPDITYTDCYFIWWGWIALIVWLSFGLAFGIPRVIYTWQYDGIKVGHFVVIIVLK